MTVVTACLIVYRRQQNLGRIIDHLARQPFISEILIRDNSRGENIINYGRYVLGAKAENEWLYTQDDDCIVENIQEIYQAFVQHPQRIAHGLGPEHFAQNEVNKYRTDKYSAQMCMMGWGSFFQKSWIPLLEKYTSRWGKGPLFYRETDRIFSTLLGCFHTTVLAKLTHLDGQSADYALWRQPEHVSFGRAAVERARQILEEEYDARHR